MESTKRQIVFAETNDADAKRLGRSSTNEGDECGRDADATEIENASHEIVVTAKPSPIGNPKTMKNKISMGLVCQTLELEFKSDVDFPVQKSAEHQLQNIKYAAKLSALYKFVAAKYVPFLMKPCVKMSQGESTISAQECTHISNDLQTLKVFLAAMAADNISDFHALAPGSLKKSLEQAFDDEKRYIDALSSFIDRTCVVLNLWKTLCEYRFSLLPQHNQNVLAACTFRDLIVGPCVLLIKQINSYLATSISTDVCSNWCRYLLAEVMDILRSTQTCVDYRKREKKVDMALQWFENIVPHIELNDDFLDELLTISNRSAGDFLIRSVLIAPDNVELVNVLWKYYKRNGRHSAATKIFDKLSSVPNAHQNLSDRIEYLEGAVKNGLCFGNGISMRNIADTLEVARVQKMILDSLSTVSNRDAQSACGRLNQQLYTIDQLYSDFVERFDLSECKSEIFQNKILQTICVEKPKDLIDLNDDCLLAIFERLTLLELSQVAEVSQRFRAIAQESFRLTKPVVRIEKDVEQILEGEEYYDEDEDEYEEEHAYDHVQVRVVKRTSEILRNFGSLIINIEIECQDEWIEQKVFRLLIKYCGESLTSLQLMSGSRRLPDWMRPIIENLKKFVLVYKYCDAFDPIIFSWLSKIEHLGIIQQKFLLPLPLNDLFRLKFEKLERFSLYTGARVECSDVAMFLQKHRGLKEIELYFENDSKDLDLFGDQWLPIEKLRTNLCIKPTVFRHLKHLQSLEFSESPTALWYEGAEEILREIIDANIPLKHLTGAFSWSENIEGLFDALSKLLHLKSVGTDDVESMIEMSSQLVRLNELEITLGDVDDLEHFTRMNELVECFPNVQRLAYDIPIENQHCVFDSDLFMEIVVALEERPDKKPLHLILRGHCSVKISNALKQRYRHILTVCSCDEVRSKFLITR